MRPAGSVATPAMGSVGAARPSNRALCVRIRHCEHAHLPSERRRSCLCGSGTTRGALDGGARASRAELPGRKADVAWRGSTMTPVAPVDLLVFGPHPDDLEIGMAGTIAKHAALGHSVGLCDLTEGEMGSNGTVDERRAEAQAATAVLGASWRVNLGIPDRAIGTSPDHASRVAALVRRARPRTVALPYWADRHPDHVAASTMLADAVFSAGLRRFPAEGEAWKPAWTCYYFINDHVAPSFVVEVSEYYDAKRRALACHVSQFAPRNPDAVATRLTSNSFQQRIESRDALFGAEIGVPFAEGFVVKQMLTRPHLLWNLEPA